MLTTDKDTNKVYSSRWINDFACFDDIKAALQLTHIEYSLLPYTKDWWVRDFMPIQLSKNEFLGYEFNPDYLQKKSSYITNPKQCCNVLGIEPHTIDIVLDGGNVIKTLDKVIMTDKVFVENKSKSQTEVIDTLEKGFGRQVVFIPWDKEEEFGHADGMVRFIEGNHVVINNYKDYDEAFREKMLEALTPHFKVSELSYDVEEPAEWNWAYINFLRVGDYMLLPSFGFDEDDQALELMSRLYPTCKIDQVMVPEIVEEGGALNCISWNIKE